MIQHYSREKKCVAFSAACTFHYAPIFHTVIVAVFFVAVVGVGVGVGVSVGTYAA